MRFLLVAHDQSLLCFTVYYHWLALLSGPQSLCNTYHCIVDLCQHPHDNKSIWISPESSESDYESDGNFHHNCSYMLRTTQKWNLVLLCWCALLPLNCSRKKISSPSVLLTSALVKFRGCICASNDTVLLTVLGFPQASISHYLRLSHGSAKMYVSTCVFVLDLLFHFMLFQLYLRIKPLHYLEKKKKNQNRIVTTGSKFVILHGMQMQGAAT